MHLLLVFLLPFLVSAGSTPGASPSTYTLSEVLTVVSPVVVTLGLVCWFFVQRWLNTYQHNLDDSLRDIRTRMDNVEKRMQIVDENLLEFQKEQMKTCRATHDGVNHELQTVSREIAEFSQKILFRSDFERDRLTLEKQGEAILAMVRDVAEELAALRTLKRHDDGDAQ